MPPVLDGERRSSVINGIAAGSGASPSFAIACGRNTWASRPSSSRSCWCTSFGGSSRRRGNSIGRVPDDDSRHPQGVADPAADAVHQRPRPFASRPTCPAAGCWSISSWIFPWPIMTTVPTPWRWYAAAAGGKPAAGESDLMCQPLAGRLRQIERRDHTVNRESPSGSMRHANPIHRVRLRDPGLMAATPPGSIPKGCQPLSVLGGFPQGVGGVADHVHLLVGLKATHCLADVLRESEKGGVRLGA